VQASQSSSLGQTLKVVLDGSVGENESRVVLLMNGKTIKEENHKQPFYVLHFHSTKE